jgi:hypothetical protein
LRLRLPEDFWTRELFSRGDRPYVQVTITGYYGKHYEPDYGEYWRRRGDDDDDET